MASLQIGTVASYYAREYYHGGERQLAATWFSRHDQFGLEDGSTVDLDAFERLHAGLDGGGASLLRKKHRRIQGFDFCFSPSKSVSLAYAFSLDTRLRADILRTHHAAVRAALVVLDEEGAFARRGKDGLLCERVALTAALFTHDSARPERHADGSTFADPQLHTHAVIMNVAARSDGTVGTLHSVVLRDWKMAAGAVYHAALAAGLQAMGLGIDRVGRNGIFEIKGISNEAIGYFSARRGEIEVELAKAGTTSSEATALAAAVARSTRAAKDCGDSSREAIWQEKAIGSGFDLASFHDRQRDRKATISHEEGERLLAERLAALPRRLTETRSVVDRRELVRMVAESCVGTGLGAERAAAAVAELLAEGQVVEIGLDPIGLPRFSTPEMIAIEREAAAIAERLVRHADVGLDPANVRVLAAAHGLSLEQTTAALAATGPARLAVVEGAPGTGKTTLLRPIVESWQAAGYRVLGTASAWRVANALRDDLGIEARATASWLARENLGLPFLDGKSVLIVDEAGLLGSREMQALLVAVEAAGARLVAVGDRGQLPSIGAGSGLAILARSVEAARITTIVRQRDAWAREAVKSFGRGAAMEALEAFAARGRLVEAEGAQAAIRTAVDHVEANLIGPAPGSALIVAKTNAEAAAVGHEVRRRLRERGFIKGEDIAIDAVTPSGHRASLVLAVGDRFRFLARNDAIGVVNGTVATVTRIAVAEPRQDQVVTSPRHARVEAMIEGRQVIFDTRDLADARGRTRLGWAYASTIYGAQGMTVERTVVLMTSRFDRHDVYVAASRARDATFLVVDRRALDREMGAAHVELGPSIPQRILAKEIATGKLKGSVMPRSPERARAKTIETSEVATSMVVSTADDVAAVAERRLAFLASRLARANVKETTLDLAAPHSLNGAFTVSQRQREQAPAYIRHQPTERLIASPEAPAVDAVRRPERRREQGLEL